MARRGEYTWSKTSTDWWLRMGKGNVEPVAMLVDDIVLVAGQSMYAGSTGLWWMTQTSGNQYPAMGKIWLWMMMMMKWKI